MPQSGLCNEDIYDALVDDDCFAALPGKLARTFGGRSTLIQWVYPDGGVELLSQSGYFSDEFLRSYSEEYARHDPWLMATASGRFVNKALSLEDLVPPSEYGSSVFYNEFVRTMGDDTFRCMGVQVANRWGSGIVAIHRGRGERSFDPRAVGMLQNYVAALRRMLAVRGRLASAHRRLESVEAMLDHMGQGALLARRDGSLVHVNARGEALLRRGDVLVERRAMLGGRTALSTTRLREAIAAACASDGVEASALLLDRPVGRPLAVSVMPLHTGHGVRLALLIVEPESKSVEAAPRLQSLYGLTPAEAEIGIRIADGASPLGIALERGVSVGTVRSQIKALSSKMSCARQSEIAALIKAFPATNATGREIDVGRVTSSA